MKCRTCLLLALFALSGCAGSIAPGYERQRENEEKKLGYLFLDIREDIGARLIRMDNDLYVENIKTAEKHPITFSPQVKKDGFFSKDGNLIVYKEYSAFMDIRPKAYYIIRFGADASRRIKISEEEYIRYLREKTGFSE
ncbi:MAG: hypothetical protein JW869_07350 [Candidatus Omnitrophica bacterium]|nr:hypothetical protein [Candidatus Omnitrophota bacterium]